MSHTIFKTITFLNGDKCDIIMPTVEDWSKIMQKHNEQLRQVSEDGHLDLYPFILERLCLFNGKKKNLEFVLKLSGDVYFKILPELNQLMNETI